MATEAIYRDITTLRDERHPGRFSTSLCAGLSILASFTAEHPVRGIAEVAEDLDMGRSTIHRYATTLTALGYLEQGPSRKYRLAVRGADIGLALLDSLALRRDAREHLRRLRNQTGHTVTLGITTDSEVPYEILCLDQMPGHRRGQYAIDVGLGVGTRQPIDRTAAGKALLAVAELTVEDEELIGGRRAVGAAVLDGDGRAIAAIEIAVPSEAFACGQLIDALGPALRATAEGISGELERNRPEQGPKRPSRLPGQPLRAGC
jgi:DNA-binding IclR family transcriptional regulator